jgi:hypothetical protein
VRTYKCTAEGGGAIQKTFSWFTGKPMAHDQLYEIVGAVKKILQDCRPAPFEIKI